ncbi:hypothetical protein ACFL2J_06135 [Candidatus Omnitrophota bacterium]
MHKRQLIFSVAMGIILLFYPCRLRAVEQLEVDQLEEEVSTEESSAEVVPVEEASTEGYSKQDIQAMIDYLDENDAKTKSQLEMHQDSIGGLINEIDKALQYYHTEIRLREHIAKLSDEYIPTSMDLEPCLAELKKEDGPKDFSELSPKCQNINKKVTYLALKIRIVSYIYKDLYREPVIDKSS